ncbi:MAG: hypothetical protein ACK46G_14190 [Flavobacteriales bacterium]
MRLRAYVLLLLCVCAQIAVHAQSIVPQAIIPAGGAASSEGVHLGWTLGQPSSASLAMGDRLITTGVQQPEGVELSLRFGVLLDGPYDEGVGLMHDSLRSAGLIPDSEPYTALGYDPAGSFGVDSLSPGALVINGPDAIVDWVWVELRKQDNEGQVVVGRAALVQRDGDVVDLDGSSPLRMMALPGAYHVAVHHRNHLPVMTMLPVVLGQVATEIDLTDGSVPVHGGTDALRFRDDRYLQWPGDVNGDGVVKYTGEDNDRDLILQAIGGVVPTAVVSGYRAEDVNLDGKVKYTGQDNDRDPVLQTIGGVVPTNTRPAQFP